MRTPIVGMRIGWPHVGSDREFDRGVVQFPKGSYFTPEDRFRLDLRLDRKYQHVTELQLRGLLMEQTILVRIHCGLAK